ncbi:hypothetical protein GCM10028801_41100 [Nocardioides maradonensis]
MTTEDVRLTDAEWEPLHDAICDGDRFDARAYIDGLLAERVKEHAARNAAEAIRSAARDWYTRNGSREINRQEMSWFFLRALRIEEEAGLGVVEGPEPRIRSGGESS